MEKYLYIYIYIYLMISFNRGMRVNFIQNTFSIISFFFLIKQMSFQPPPFSTLPTKHYEKKLKFFLFSHFSFPSLQPNGS